MVCCFEQINQMNSSKKKFKKKFKKKKRYFLQFLASIIDIDVYQMAKKSFPPYYRHLGASVG